MDRLVNLQCVACRSDSPSVTEAELAAFKPQIPAWQLLDRQGMKQLERTFDFKDFSQALDFTNRVGRLAEDQGHHPAILTEWGKVTVTWWTHAIRGLHKNDLIMAARTDQIYAEMPHASAK